MKKYIWYFIMIVVVAVLLIVFSNMARADVTFSCNVQDGQVMMSSYATGNSDVTVDKYSMKLYAPFVSEAQVSHSFTGMAETSIDMTTNFPLPTARYSEKIGIMAASDVRCFEEAAGSKFKASQIEFSSMAGATETGIGYIADSPSGIGSIKFAYAQNEYVRVFSKEEEGIDPVVINQTYSTIKYEAGVKGAWFDFYGAVEPPLNPPAAMVDDISDWVKPWALCPWTE